MHSSTASPADFDSDLEREFAREWGEAPRAGWQLRREEDILCDGQTVFTPDFTLRHRDGRRLLLEIVGYWTPEYLEAKRRTLATFRDAPLVLAVAESASRQLPPMEPPPVVFKRRLRPVQVLEWLERFQGGAVAHSKPE